MIKDRQNGNIEATLAWPGPVCGVRPPSDGHDDPTIGALTNLGVRTTPPGMVVPASPCSSPSEHVSAPYNAAPPAGGHLAKGIEVVVR